MISPLDNSAPITTDAHQSPLATTQGESLKNGSQPISRLQCIWNYFSYLNPHVFMRVFNNVRRLCNSEASLLRHMPPSGPPQIESTPQHQQAPAPRLLHPGYEVLEPDEVRNRPFKRADWEMLAKIASLPEHRTFHFNGKDYYEPMQSTVGLLSYILTRVPSGLYEQATVCICTTKLYSLSFETPFAYIALKKCDRGWNLPFSNQLGLWNAARTARSEQLNALKIIRGDLIKANKESQWMYGGFMEMPSEDVCRYCPDDKESAAKHDFILMFFTPCQRVTIEEI
jgi:hypothetical protein